MKKRTTGIKRKTTSPLSIPIVAIGASAGGLEALDELVKNLTPNTGIAYIFIQHPAPRDEKKTDKVLAAATKMKVLRARHKLSLKSNHIYIIPSDKDVTVENGHLCLNPKTSRTALHLPIDKFFISLADNLSQAAVGVLLSGNASDGTLGLKAIKASGGLTFAQDDSAKFPGMPASAVAEGVVDKVLSPKNIAKEIVSISRQAVILKKNNSLSKDDLHYEDEDVVPIIQLLKKALGIDFSHYKITTIRRRIIRRMLLHQLDTLKEYHSHLLQNPAEIHTLYQDLLINVTSFFRDADAMEYFKKSLLPKLLKAKTAKDPLRIWVPACSTGEEAYTIAMIVLESIGEKGQTVPVQIFATDLSDFAISKARIGLYSQADLANVSPKRLQNFFTKIDGSYRISKSIRDLCIFAPHNIFKDPPFSKLDFISCCNLMIYLDNVLQKKIITTFHYALNPGGYLMLGKSETITSSQVLFTQLEKKYKIYSRKGEKTGNALFDLSVRKGKPESILPITVKKFSQKELRNEKSFDKLVEDILLTKFIPASVVITEDMEIVQFRGSTGMFLEPSPGKASLNLIKMAKPGLAFELRNVIYKASKSGQMVRKTGIEVKYNRGNIYAAISVVPIPSDGDDRYFLVLFEEQLVDNVTLSSSSAPKDKLVKKLETDLKNAKEDMHAFIAEQEATNEELQSANEEIVSSNEELQSINEELETSKEEIESTNEELLTINTELQTRNDQLTESYEYSEAIFEIIREAVLVLTKDLRVKFANKAFYKIFQTAEAETEGHYVFNLGDQQWNIPALKEKLQDIQLRNIEFHGFEVKHTFPKIGEKIMLLHARSIVQKNHKQQLILLAIEDTTGHAIGQRVIAEREAWMRNVADNLPVIVWVINAQKACTFLNNTWYEFTGNRQVNLHWEEIVYPDDLGNFLKNYTLGFKSKKAFTIEFRMRNKNSQYYWMYLSANPSTSATGDFTGFVGSITNINDQKTFSEQMESNVTVRTKALLDSNKKLGQSNEELQQFAYVASHDLQEPLRKMTTFSDRAKTMFSEGDMREIPSYLDKIIEAASRMSRLINDLLNFSRVSQVDEFVNTDLNAIIKEVTTDLDLPLKNIRLKTDSLPSIPAIPIQMRQLFQNMISNAIKFSADVPKPEIRIAGKILRNGQVPGTLNPSRRYIEITVQDNGIGFDQQFAEQIFIIFQRLHDRKTYPGTGIGLALCKKIVANHEGTIFARSIAGKGAAFHIVLPLE